MKKLKLKALELGATEMLTRAQLKNVLGGGGGVTTTQASCTASATCSDGTKISCSCPAGGGSCNDSATSVSCTCAHGGTTGEACADA